MELAGLASVVTFLCAWAASAQAVPRQRVPFVYYDTRVYVPVTVGPGRFWFVLDDGVSPTILDTRTAKQMEIVGRDPSVTTGAGSGSAPVQRADPVTLRVGDMPLRTARTTIVPLDSILAMYGGRHVPGIIGSTFFLQHTITLDFDDDVMTVEPPGSSVVPAGAVVVPLRIDGAGIPYAQATLTLPGGRTMSLNVLPDLGAKASLLVSEPFIAREHLDRTPARRVRMPLGAGVGGETRYDFVRMERLTIGAPRQTRIRDFIAGLSVEGTLSFGSFDALLGAGFMSRYRVTFDYAKSRLVLLPRSGSDDGPEPFDASGMFLVAQGEKLDTLRVWQIAGGTPASEAGLEKGDRILTVDGTPAAELGLQRVRAILTGRSGTRVVFVVRRDGATRQVTLTLRQRL